MNTLRRILTLMIKEFGMILKDPKSRFVIIGPPLIQFFVFGYAATFDLKNVRYAVLDESHSAESRQLLSHLEGSQNFELAGTLFSTEDIATVINEEKARLVVHIGPRFSEELYTNQSTTLQVIVDGRNSNVALIALGYINSIVEQFNQELIQNGVVTTRGAGITLQERAWFNANLQSRWFIVSGLGGVISMVVVMVLTSLSVAREREFGTFDQLLVTPFTPAEILIGKSLPGICFGLMDSLLFAAGAVLWFEVPFRGTISALV
ncbi:MAG: ABC transporter permease, partial [Desulfobacteraceae bacterium]